MGISTRFLANPESLFYFSAPCESARNFILQKKKAKNEYVIIPAHLLSILICVHNMFRTCE